MDEIGENSENIGIHPKEKANFLSKLFHIWVIPFLFVKNKTKFYAPLREYDCEMLSTRLEKEWKKQSDKSKNPSLCICLIKLFYKELMINGVMLLVMKLVVVIYQPIVFSHILDYFTPNQSKLSAEEGLLYILAMIALLIFQALVYHGAFASMYITGLKFRAAFSGVIYRKVLNSSKQQLESCANTEKIINLLSNDSNHIIFGFVYIQYLLSTPIEMVVTAICMYFNLGYSALAGVCLFILIVFYEIYLTITFKKLKNKANKATETRIKLITEFVCGMQIIKMYAWNDYFKTLISNARNLEMKVMKGVTSKKILHICFKQFIISWAMCVTIYVATALESTINLHFVFMALIYYNILKNSITMQLPLAISYFGEMKHVVARIETILVQDLSVKTRKTEQSTVGVTLEKIVAKWGSTQASDCLIDVDFRISSPGLTAIVGTSGCGKSALLCTILNETHIVQGRLSVEGKISYAAQDPWIFPASIRQNILFGNQLTEERYQTVIKACGLEHDISLFQDGDKSLVGERGVLLSGGQKARIGLARAVYHEADIYLFDDPFSAVDFQIAQHIFKNCISKFLSKKIVILVTHQIHLLKGLQQMYVMEKSKIKKKMSYEKLVDAKLQDQEIKNTIISKKEEKKLEYTSKETKKKILQGLYKFFTIDKKYCIYLVLILGFIAGQVAVNTGDFFLVLSLARDEIGSRDFLYVYSALAVGGGAFVVLRTVLYIECCTKSSKTLHNSVIDDVSLATMQFFNKETSGNILNRFSKSMGLVDQFLPIFFLEIFQNVLFSLGALLLVSLMNYQFAILSVFFLGFLYFVLSRLLLIVTEVFIKEILSRSLIFTHVVVSMQGLTTVRALNAQEILIKEFDQLESRNCAQYYLKINLAVMVAFFLDCVCILFIVFIFLFCYFLQSEQQVQNIGLTIFQIISLINLLPSSARLFFEFYVICLSLCEIQEYANVTPETDKGVVSFPKKPHLVGSIKFDSVGLQYDSGAPLVLRQINLEIQSKEKVGIVGRTGSGKSSLISAFFRLYEFTGNITIDGVDINHISLKELRSNIAIIPQNPILFSGSLRKNLDPFSKYSDAKIWKAIEEVQMKSSISGLPNGLETVVQDSGANFSSGQCQLICFIRAILRNCQIIILDEVTANIDLETAQIMQNVIKQKFAKATVLTIAHRLYSVIDSDKILTLSEGNIVEFDHPYRLLQEPEGYFYNQVLQNGQEVMEELTNIAKINFQKNIK